jgi:hypothetical protein
MNSNQEEARGVGPIDRVEFAGAVSEVIKARQPEGRRSRSLSDENLSGKRIEIPIKMFQLI